MLWTKKYSPKSIDEVVGNTDAREKVKVWAMDWSRGTRKPPLLLSGPPGIGKTCIAHSIARSNGWEVLEVNASDVRNKKGIEALLGAASTSASLTGALKLILVDEIDGTSERGGVSAIYEVAKTSLQPMILVANDPWAPSMAPLRTACTRIEMRRVNVRSVAARLRRIAEAEGAPVKEEVIEDIARQSNGDMRSAINDLQSVAGGGSRALGRDREKNIFDCVRKVFKSRTYADAKTALYGLDVDRDMFFKWIDENIPREYENPGDMARAFDSLSRSDVFYGRIRRRQHWAFIRYYNDFMTAGVALAKAEAYHKFTKYSFPEVIRKLSSSKSSRTKEKKVLGRIGERCHVSTRRARGYVQLVKLMLKGENASAVERYFKFDEEDLSYLTGKKGKTSGTKRKRKKKA